MTHLLQTNLLHTPTLTLWLAGALAALGIVRLLTTEDAIARLVALNVAGAGTLLALVGLSIRTDVPDAVPQALALTGIVITVAITGVGLVLAVRAGTADDEGEDRDAEPDEAVQTDYADDPGEDRDPAPSQSADAERDGQAGAAP